MVVSLIALAIARPTFAPLAISTITLLGVVIAQVITVVLANRARTDLRDVEAERARAVALQSYLEQMGTLITNRKLRRWSTESLLAEDEIEEARGVAAAQTLSVLEALDPDPARKRVVVRFLYFSALITQSPMRNRQVPVVDLRDANLGGADLAGLVLRGVILAGANLEGARLGKSVLIGADLREANLARADLEEADLRGADLQGADLTGANLWGAKRDGDEPAEERPDGSTTGRGS